MRRRSKITLAAAGVVGASALSYLQMFGIPAASPVLADLPIGTAAPDFRATDADGRAVSLADFRGKTVVLEWNNPQCPTVKEHYESGTMQKTQAAAASDGVVWLTINSGGPWRQGHMNGAEAKAYVAAQRAQPTAYLLDPEGLVGRPYGAKATPHLYVVNKAGALVYRGGISGGIDTPAKSEADKGPRNHVLAALRELKAGEPVSVPTSRAYGCSVKYS
ncbi:MAG TPA: redoxin domain-containing protein [Allosphingosinicella sp.]|uniref:redoxin domain-containing protein n=1 Tax=Allosphingosinicella sp. TaxID=2823234 RepID=UPI002F2760BC